MRPAAMISMLLKIRIDGNPAINADNAVRILCDIDNPVASIVATNGPGQRNAARYCSDSQ